MKPRLSTTSFMENTNTTLERVKEEEKVIEEERIIEERVDDDEQLLNVDLGMFCDDDDESIVEGRRAGEGDHPALYYTVTLNWVADNKDSDESDTDAPSSEQL